jgi:hypothetical protein
MTFSLCSIIMKHKYRVEKKLKLTMILRFSMYLMEQHSIRKKLTCNLLDNYYVVYMTI